MYIVFIFGKEYSKNKFRYYRISISIHKPVTNVRKPLTDFGSLSHTDSTLLYLNLSICCLGTEYDQYYSQF